ncbi:MAG TPA: FadD3 family acyl-CoA ligase [Acidimicrobiales bacterium]|nr:FadD3 family acyl-CoA ligase [Acidimicrobiales bacterium]
MSTTTDTDTGTATDTGTDTGRGIGGAPPEQEDPRADLTWGTIPRLVEDIATRHGATEALVDGPVRLTYAQLAPEADRYARGFVATGIGAGERVAIWAPNCAEWMLAALGALRAGAVLVPLNTRFKGGEAAYIVRNAGATALVTVRGFLGVDYPALLAGEDVRPLRRIVLLRDEGPETGRGEPAVPLTRLDDFLAGGEAVDPAETAARAAALQPHDPSDLIFTSGTTGYPKGAVTTHAQSLRTFGTWSSIVGLGPGDRYLVVNPFFHTFGYKAGILACLMAGATVVPEPVFDAAKVMERIPAEHISVLPGPPTLYQTLLADPRRHEHDLSSLRLGVTGAAVVPVELVQAMADELGFTTVLTAYGLTESCGTVTMCRRSDPPDIISGTSGRAIPGLEVRVVVNGQPVPAGEPGEIVVRGYTVMSGYWGNEEATAEAIDAEGWLHTGDIGVLDEAGNVTITDRVKDMYVVGGFNAYPAEIEAILRRHDGVAQVAVVGIPDERMGEVGCAYVVPADAGADPEELGRALLGWSRGAMANYKVPRGVVLVEALPVNASGKVLKRELRDRHAAGADRVVVL